MDFLSDETVRQYIFDFVFIVGTAILLQVCILKLVRQAMANEDDDIGTMFDLLSVTHSYTNKKTGECVEVEDETASAVASAVALFVLLAIGVLIMFFLSRYVNGERLGFVITFFVGMQIATLILNRFERVGKYVHHVSRILLGLISGYIWYASNNWIVDDVFAVIGCLLWAQVLVRPVPLKALFAGSLAIIVYDFWGVWGAKAVGGGAITASVQTFSETHLPPLAIISPALPLEMLSGTSTVLGLGDVLLPAFVICTAARYGLHRVVLGSYLVGLIATGIILVVYQTAVPAMVPVLPIMLTTFFLTAKAKGIRLRENKIEKSESEANSVP